MSIFDKDVFDLKPIEESCEPTITGNIFDPLPDPDCSTGGGGVSIHNQLSGLQGGTANERYHVNRSVYEALAVNAEASALNRFLVLEDLESIPIPTLQSVTTGTSNNVTDNSIQFTGVNNLDLTKDGGFLAYDESISSFVLGVISGGSPVNYLAMSESDIVFYMGVSQRLFLREETSTITGAGFSSRVRGFAALLGDDFVTLDQTENLIASIPPVDLSNYVTLNTNQTITALKTFEDNIFMKDPNDTMSSTLGSGTVVYREDHDNPNTRRVQVDPFGIHIKTSASGNHKGTTIASNSVTAARTLQVPDKSGIIATLDDIPSVTEFEVLTNKQNSLAADATNTKYPTVTAVNVGLNTKLNASEKGIVNGVATLGASGKIPNSQIPAIAISETFVVASEAAMLSLINAEQGDVAVRTDVSKSFILAQSPSGVLANWQELLTPMSPVQSVNGQTGVVVISKSDVGLGSVDNTSDLDKPISTLTQAALNDKANKDGSNVALPLIGSNLVNLTYLQGNYYDATNSDTRYASFTGSNATGTWPIGITGNAETATYFGNLDADFTTFGTDPLTLWGFDNTAGSGRAFNKTQLNTFLGIPSGGINLQTVTDIGNSTTNSITSWGGFITGNQNGDIVSAFSYGPTYAIAGTQTNHPFALRAGGTDYVTLQTNGQVDVNGYLKSTGLSGNMFGFRYNTNPEIQIYQNDSNYGFYNTVTSTQNLVFDNTTGHATLSSNLDINGTTVKLGGVRRFLKSGDMHWDFMGSDGWGVLTSDGGLGVMTLDGSGNLDLVGNVTAPNFIGNLTGSASLWNGYANDFTTIQTSAPSYVIGMDGSGGIKRYNNTAIADLLSGSILDVSISGNAATSSNSTLWGGLPLNAGAITNPTYFLTLNSDGNAAGSSTLAEVKAALEIPDISGFLKTTGNDTKSGRLTLNSPVGASATNGDASLAPLIVAGGKAGNGVASSGFAIGGSAAEIKITGGFGGDAVTANTGTNVSGNGANVYILGGDGGQATNAATNLGGRGGDAILQGGGSYGGIAGSAQIKAGNNQLAAGLGGNVYVVAGYGNNTNVDDPTYNGSIFLGVSEALAVRGNTIIGSITDDRVNKFQVTGSSKFTGNVDVTGNLTAVTQSPNDNSTKVATTAYVDAAVSGGGGGAVTSLTTTGTSGAATLISGVLNIPNYTISNYVNTTGTQSSIAGNKTWIGKQIFNTQSGYVEILDPAFSSVQKIVISPSSVAAQAGASNKATSLGYSGITFTDGVNSGGYTTLGVEETVATGRVVNIPGVNGTALVLSTTTAPTTSSSTGTKGAVVISGGYRYECTDTNTWVRSAVSTF